jgi:hypothetical protein
MLHNNAAAICPIDLKWRLATVKLQNKAATYIVKSI